MLEVPPRRGQRPTTPTRLLTARLETSRNNRIADMGISAMRDLFPVRENKNLQARIVVLAGNDIE